MIRHPKKRPKKKVRSARQVISPDIQTQLQQAFVKHKAGRLDQAEAIYHQVLEAEPENFDALNLVGVIEAKSGRYEAATDYFIRAIRKDPKNAQVHYNLGNALKDLGRPEDAVDSYRHALEFDPKSAETHYNLGVMNQKLGHLDAAAESYQHAIQINPGYTKAYINLGTVFKDLGKLEAATANCRSAIKIDPDYAGAHDVLGSVLQKAEKFDEAVASYRHALKISPDFALAHYHLGSLFQQFGRFDEAINSYRSSLEIESENATLHNNLGVIFQQLGKMKDALACYRRSLEIKPEYVEAYANFGSALALVGKFDEAIAHLHKAIELNPKFSGAYNNLGNVLKDRGQIDESIANFTKAITLNPNMVTAHSNLVFTMNYVSKYLPGDIWAESKRWAATFGKPENTIFHSFNNERDPERLLRIGYVSPDFRQHSVSYFFASLLASHHRKEVVVVCYAEVIKQDDTTHRLRELSDDWRSTVGLSDHQVAEQVRSDKVDILVDLAGHTANSRLPVFALKPAPVQVSWLGYPNSTGLRAMDYRLTDAISDPPGVADAYHSETLIRLPHGSHCYGPPADAPEVESLPAQRMGHITFGSFNSLAKVTPEVVSIWARILDGVPESRMLVKCGGFSDDTTRRRWENIFEASGISLDRLELVPYQASTESHLALYGRIDVALDTFPYNGTTTTCEALWMGVPVVTLKADRPAGRVGASLLTTVGLNHLIADGVDDYISKARELAGNLNQLSDLREGMRRHLAASPLCDAAGFATDIETVYRQIWRRWCANN